MLPSLTLVTFLLCRAGDISDGVYRVDEVTISGASIPGQFVAKVREIISSAGLKSHKLKYQTGNKAVFITGVGVVGSNLVVPKRVERRSKELWRDFQRAVTLDEIDITSTRLLAHLGGIRHVVGKGSKRGRKLSSEMNSIRQKREKAFRQNTEFLRQESSGRQLLTPDEQEARKDEIAAIPF